ncbi:MAG: hypothetical protein QM677_03065 [Microbacterium sp.]
MNDGRDDEKGTETDRRSRWGRVRFGAGRMPALWVAAPVGLVLAIGIAVLAVATDSAGSRPILGGSVIAVMTWWPCLGIAWALIVDRETLRGAIDNPEQSVESVWYEKAASGAFTDVLLVAGLGTAAVAFTGIEISAVNALAAVVLIAMGSFAVRYLIQRRRG